MSLLDTVEKMLASKRPTPRLTAQMEEAQPSPNPILEQMKKFEKAWPSQVKMISPDIQEKPDSALEWEMRFGSIDSVNGEWKYQPRISELSYQFIRETLDGYCQRRPKSIQCEESMYDSVSYDLPEIKHLRHVIRYEVNNPLDVRAVHELVHRKTRIANWMVGYLPIRIGVSREDKPKPWTPTEMDVSRIYDRIPDGHVLSRQRRITRHSYTISNEKSFLYGWQLDVSNITVTTEFKDQPMQRQVSYEFEMERVLIPDDASDIRWVHAMAIGLSLVNFRIPKMTGVFIRDAEGKARKALNATVKTVMDANDYVTVTSAVNYALSRDARGNYPRSLNLNILNKPVDLRLDSLMDPSFHAYITAKVDGKRCLLVVRQGHVYVCMKSGTNVVLKVASPPEPIIQEQKVSRRREEGVIKAEITQIERHVPLEDAIFDAEWYQHEMVGDERRSRYTVFVFDALVIAGNDLRGLTLDGRLSQARRYPLDHLSSQRAEYEPEVTFVFKPFQTPAHANVPQQRNPDQSITDGMRESPPPIAEGIRTDGYILYEEQPYMITSVGTELHRPKPIFGKVYKYKPPAMLTIDFLVTEVRKEYFLEVHHRPDQTKKYHAFVKTMGRKLYITRPEALPQGYTIWGILNRVCEFRYDADEDMFILERMRADKTYGNNVDVAWNVWKDIENPIRDTTFFGKDLILMRRFHNLYKSDMLHKYGRGVTMVDIGSGRGGDLQKWRQAQVKQVYAIEPNPANRAEFERRLATQKERKVRSGQLGLPMPKITLLPYGAQQADILLSPEGITNMSDVRLVTSFFSLTYFFSDASMIQGLMDWLSQCPLNTRFVGAMLDGDKVMDALNAAREANPNLAPGQYVTWENPAFTIEQTSDMDPSQVFGKTIKVTLNDPDSMVHEQVEYITSFIYLRDQLKSAGYSLNTLVSADDKTTFFLDETYHPRVKRSVQPGTVRIGPKKSMYDTLNVYGREWSALNRYFVFTKTRGLGGPQPLVPSQKIVAAFETDSKKPRIPEGTRVPLANPPPMTPDAAFIMLYPLGLPRRQILQADGTRQEVDDLFVPPYGYHPILLPILYSFKPEFRVASHELRVKYLRGLAIKLKQRVMAETTPATFEDYLDGRVYRALLLDQRQEYQAQSLTTTSLPPLVPYTPEEAYKQFLKILVSATEMHRLPSDLLAHLISHEIKRAVIVLTTTGQYWSLSPQGLSLEDLEAPEYKRSTLPLYSDYTKRNVLYPLMMQNVPQTETGYKISPVSLDKLILWLGVQTPEMQAIDTIYYKAMTIMESGQSLYDAVTAREEKKQAMRTPAEIKEEKRGLRTGTRTPAETKAALDVLAQELTRLSLELQAIGSEYAQERSAVLEEWQHELETMRDQLQGGLPEQVEEDEYMSEEEEEMVIQPERTYETEIGMYDPSLG